MKQSTNLLIPGVIAILLGLVTIALLLHELRYGPDTDVVLHDDGTYVRVSNTHIEHGSGITSSRTMRVRAWTFLDEDDLWIGTTRCGETWLYDPGKQLAFQVLLPHGAGGGAR